ncbi:hypothetical protein SPKIRA_18810 [Sphingomonas paucimobilis]|nr:hypothetical protein SPKIRA_18810 [Sphingomonas paucimobilis]
MRIEGRDQRRTPLGPGTRDGGPDHRLMTEMKSVEIAQRDDPAGQRRRNGLRAIKTLHGRAL